MIQVTQDLGHVTVVDDIVSSSDGSSQSPGSPLFMRLNDVDTLLANADELITDARAMVSRKIQQLSRNTVKMGSLVVNNCEALLVRLQIITQREAPSQDGTNTERARMLIFGRIVCIH